MITWLYAVSPLPPSGAPKLQAQRSACSSSLPSFAHQASPNGSVIASFCSWLIVLIVVSASPPLGDDSESQPEMVAWYGSFA